MANSALTLSSLDFNTLKANFQSYLTSQSVLKDYNFNSSAMNVLLDVMSYNSYLNSFYLNMVMAEMFLDSATKLNSVVSHSKELNYLPRSAASSAANISFIVNTNGITNPFIVPDGAMFSGTNSNGTYTFITDTTTSYTSSNSTYTVNNLIIYEGQTVTDSFIIDYTQEQQVFVLSNPNIDISSLVVTVFENTSNTSNTGVVYNETSTLFNLNSNSTVYFIQAAQDGQYEILFGDGLLGYVPYNNSLVTANYRIASGSVADGISSFIMIQNLGEFNGGTATVVGVINTTSNSTGGAAQESITSIKFNAPRYFATQDRAVATDDYSALILDNFGGEISDVIVYGGELLTPKQYGRVAVCLKPTNATITPDYIKNQVTSYLRNYIGIPFRVIITDPDYFYCSVNSAVSYSTANTSLSAFDIQGEVISTILSYGTNNLSEFDSDFRYSKFVADIDDSDPSILSNDTTVLMIKRFTPVINVTSSYIFNFNNPASVENFTYQLTPVAAGYTDPVVYTSEFTYVDIYGNQYNNAIIRDDSYGNLIVFDQINGVIVNLNTTVGTVNYTTGQIQINNVNIASFAGNYISLYFVLENTDILVSQNQILLIDLPDVSVTMISS